MAKEVIRKCCVNCHSYLNEPDYCQGVGNVETGHCHEYEESLYINNYTKSRYIIDKED